MKRELEIEAQTDCIVKGSLKTCTNCMDWSDNFIPYEPNAPKTETCVKFNMKPPADVIVVGCIYHVMAPPF